MTRNLFVVFMPFLLTARAFADVRVARTAEALTVENDLIRFQLGLPTGACPTGLWLAGDERNLLGGSVEMSFYYDESKQWVAERYFGGSEVAVQETADAVTVQVDVVQFPGWAVRKAFTMRADSPVVQVVYHLRARQPDHPYPLIPLFLNGAAELSSLVSAGGRVPGSDLEVSDYALQLNEPNWYAFQAPESGRGLAVALVQWPPLYKQHWIGHHGNGALHLQARTFPEHPFEPGAEVRFAYNLIAFRGDAAAAAEWALTAGEGPLEPLPAAAPPEAGLNSRIWPAEEQDHTLYVARETVQHFFFFAANHSDETREAFDFVLLLPEGMEFLDATGETMDTYYRAQEVRREAVARDGVPYQRITITANRALGPSRLESLRFFNAYCGAVKATDGIADGRHRMFYHLQAPGEQEKEHELALVILPAPTGRQPQQITVGVSGWTMCPSPPFWRGLMETYRRCGVNVVESHLATSHDDFLQSLRNQGHRPWILTWWFWWNDAYLKAHPDAAAIRFDGSPDTQRICPEIVADPTNDVIAGVMDGYIQAFKKGALEVYWWDLEGPNAFEVCFCERCVERFRREQGLPAEEELTPLKLQAKYTDEWVAFACDQTARICARMQQYARDHASPSPLTKEGERGSGLPSDLPPPLLRKEGGVPTVPKLAVYSGLQSSTTMRDYRVDWARIAPHVDLAAPSFYSFGPANLGDLFTQGIRDAIRVVREVRDIPVLATLTTGYEGADLVRDARTTRMQILKAVAHGMDGVFFWWWGTNDGRHYRAIGEATAVIAELEPFFTEGENREEWFSLETMAASHAAWQRGDQIALLLFNHDAENTAEITVRPAALPAPDRWQVAAADPRDPAPTWTEEGLTARVPALDARWVVLKKG